MPQLRIRLAAHPSQDSATLNFSDEELAFVKQCAASHGYAQHYGTSTYIRDLGERAASQEDQTCPPAEILRAAADRSGLSLGAWLKLVALSVPGGVPLEQQLRYAREAFERGEVRR